MVAFYSYDADGRCTSKTTYQLANQPINQLTYSYNDISKMLLAGTDSSGNVTRSYTTDTDEYGNLISIELPVLPAQSSSALLTVNSVEGAKLKGE